MPRLCRVRTFFRTSWLLIASVMPIYAATSSASATSHATATSISYSEIDDLSIAVNDAIAKRKSDGRPNVLLVFDIDNTLLKMPQFLGSDQWFNDQARRIAEHDDAQFASMDDLIAAQSGLFELGTMTATQPDVGFLIDKARAQGVDIALLSARSPNLYQATERELIRNHVQLNSRPICVIFFCSESGVFDDSQIRAALKVLGTEPKEGQYRSILVRDGIMMVAGQDKGEMLRILLGATRGNTYQAVLFVDDTRKNIESVQGAGLGIPISVYYYTRLPTKVTSRDRERGDAQYRKFLDAMCSAMASRLCRAN